MENFNNCSVLVRFSRDGKTSQVELNSLTSATEYITDVVLKNGWKFISMQRGTEYKVEEKPTTRTFAEIMREVRKVWKNPYFGAVPYIDALEQVDSSDPDASYLFETAKDIVPYFLANATTFRGVDARRIKAELKKMCNIK